MNSETVKNTTYDEASAVTYEVMAKRTLTDGELFLAIRTAILRSGKRPQPGETLVISFENSKPAAARVPGQPL